MLPVIKRATREEHSISYSPFPTSTPKTSLHLRMQNFAHAYAKRCRISCKRLHPPATFDKGYGILPTAGRGVHNERIKIFSSTRAGQKLDERVALGGFLHRKPLLSKGTRGAECIVRKESGGAIVCTRRLSFILVEILDLQTTAGAGLTGEGRYRLRGF